MMTQGLNPKLPHNILVIKLSALGDFIQALGPMAAIRAHHKGAKITLLTTKGFAKFAQECGYFDEVIIDKRPKAFDVFGWFSLAKRLNAGAFSRVYDLQNNDRTALYYKLLGAPKPEWVGALPHGSHYNAPSAAKDIHAFDRHAGALGLVGITGVQVDKLAWMKADISRFALKAPYVLLVPGCAPSRPEKRWPAVHYADLANRLVAEGIQPVIIGTDDERDATAVIAQACADALDLTGQTNLYDIVALGRDAAGAVGNDTGPMHMIGATGVSSLVLFSAHSDPVRHAPKGDHVDVIQHDPLTQLGVETVMDAFTTLCKMS